MEERDPGYDDWFDEPAPPSKEGGRSSGSSGVYDEPSAEDVWVLPEDAPRARRTRGSGGGIVIGNVTLTTTQAAIIGAAILAIFFGILAAAGVFSGGTKATAPPIRTTTLPKVPTTTTTFTQTATAPTTQLKPGATGPQVKLLQQTLNALGFPVGKPDGDYGPNTQSAVEQFQSSKGLTADGVVGPQTLQALQQALNGSG